MVRMVARQVGLGGLQPVDETVAHEEVQVPVNAQRRDLAPLPLLQQRDEFVRGKRPIASQHFRVDRQSGGRQPLALLRTTRLGELSPFRREWRRACRLSSHFETPSGTRDHSGSQRSSFIGFNQEAVKLRFTTLLHPVPYMR